MVRMSEVELWSGLFSVNCGPDERNLTAVRMSEVDLWSG